MNIFVTVADANRQWKSKSEYEDYVGFDMSAEWTPPDYHAVFCEGNDLRSGNCSERHQRKPGSSKLRQI
ncbi:hypothetical protein Y032_0017g3195 [Ancylostoma ceylanicum]|uniref:Uncharacterized protein n=1 Tax=Ancylostoma ceylanicum TaxID=53326 RepID=A0A016V5A0_9BILA|nr:hypothetical protein Y032_0017g3195 [Ancylostoma ceylanicum]